MDEIVLHLCSGPESVGQVRLHVSTPPSRVKAILADGTELDYAKDDLYECLQALRHDLEERNVLLACQGARRNVFPSGLTRQMSDGRLAYALSPGREATDDDLVDVFAPADCGECATLADQSAAFSEFFAK